MVRDVNPDLEVAVLLKNKSDNDDALKTNRNENKDYILRYVQAMEVKEQEERRVAADKLAESERRKTLPPYQLLPLLKNAMRLLAAEAAQASASGYVGYLLKRGGSEGWVAPNIRLSAPLLLGLACAPVVFLVCPTYIQPTL